MNFKLNESSLTPIEVVIGIVLTGVLFTLGYFLGAGIVKLLLK